MGALVCYGTEHSLPPDASCLSPASRMLPAARAPFEQPGTAGVGAGVGGGPPPFDFKDWAKIFSGPSANQKFSLAPSAPITLDQRFLSAPSAPLKPQHHRKGGGGGGGGVWAPLPS